jgi:hypothetical protein
MNKQALWESLKEPLRLLVLAVIPFAIAYLTEFNYQWAIAITVLLRWLDKYLHELALEQATKKRNEGILGVKGLTGF